MASETESRSGKIGEKLAVKVCFWCGATKFRRVNRRGMLQRYVLTALGWYPWECSICRRKTFRRKSG